MGDRGKRTRRFTIFVAHISSRIATGLSSKTLFLNKEPRRAPKVFQLVSHFLLTTNLREDSESPPNLQARQSRHEM